MQVPVSGQNEIEGRAQLLGYSRHPAPSTETNRAVELTFYMRTLGPLPANETFDVSLASADGALWGAWLPHPNLNWQPEAIVEWRGSLSLPEDIPAGTYRLVVRLMDTKLDSEVNRFSLEEAALTIDD
jgi:hypothetical protein